MARELTQDGDLDSGFRLEPSWVLSGAVGRASRRLPPLVTALVLALALVFVLIAAMAAALGWMFWRQWQMIAAASGPREPPAARARRGGKRAG